MDAPTLLLLALLVALFAGGLRCAHRSRTRCGGYRPIARHYPGDETLGDEAGRIPRARR